MMGDARRKDYEPIYLGGKNGLLATGKFKISPAGVGWKNGKTQQIITIAAGDMKRATWSRVAKDFEVMLVKMDASVWKFDGFPRDAYEDIAGLFKVYYSINLEVKEYSLRGYNWGSTEFRGPTFSFNVANKTAFEIPLSDIVTTSVPAKNEVAVEFKLPESFGDRFGESGEQVAKPSKEDFLVEMRLYVPGVAMEAQVTGTEDGRMLLKDADELDAAQQAIELEGGAESGEILGSDKPALDEDGQAMSAAHVLCETFKQKADVGAPETNYIANFEEILLLAPRGRFEIRLFDTFFRLVGKSNEFKILYSSVSRLFIMPKPTETQWQFTVSLDPPLRHGQTRYPFLVFQIERDDEIDLDLSLEESEIEEKYAGKLQKSYDAPLYEVLPSVFKGLSGKKLLGVSETFKQLADSSGMKCSMKANESFIYPLERGFLVVSKPTLFMAHKDITSMNMSRLSSISSKTFEVTFTLSNGTEHVFMSIDRDMHEPLSQFCKDKGLNVVMAKAVEMVDVEDGYSEDEEEEGSGRRKRRSHLDRMDTVAMDEDDDEGSSVDGDFVGEDASSVDEEYDENFVSSDEEGGKSGAASDDDNRNLSDNESRPSKSKSSKKSKLPSSPALSTAASDSGAGKKKRQKKDPNAPKRGLSAFLFFSGAKRDEIRASNPGASVGDVAKILGSMWKEISADEKEIYEAMASKDKARYEAQMAQFKAGQFAPTSKGSSSTANTKSSAMSEEMVVSDDDDDDE